MLEFKVNHDFDGKCGYEDEGRTVYEAYLDGVEVADATVNAINEDGVYCDYINVHEGYRNQGIGTKFLQFLADTHERVYLAPDNENARRLYDRLGVEVTNRGDWWSLDQGFGVYCIW